MDILLNINTALTTTLHNDMLLIKEDLDIPTLFISLRNLLGRQFKIIGYQIDFVLHPFDFPFVSRPRGIPRNFKTGLYDAVLRL